ncbi:MAG: hypothetical protein LBH74_03980 [Nitrososphaerota archaeon]|jgi:protein subunit release factor A|nr:hypothetical protein [Nitrososphaerota archaeon]
MVLVAKSKKLKQRQRMLNYHRIKTLEELAANKYAHTHSLTPNSKHQLKEIIYTSTPEDLTKAVLSELRELRGGEIPTFEQGIVIHDSKGTGALDY